MAIAHVGGITYHAPEGGPGTPITFTYPGVGAGNCLIMSVGMRRNVTDAHGLPYITDSNGNIWLAPITTPSQVDNVSGETFCDFQLLTFVAPNVAAGDTEFTIHESEHFGLWMIAVDEYSGITGTYPIDQVSFASTAYESGLSSIGSGSITAASGELVYTAVFAVADPTTLGVTAGFTQRQLDGFTYDGVYSGTLGTYDQLSSGGSFSNTATSSAVPLTLHTNIIGLASANPTRPLVQLAAYALSSIQGPETSVAFPYPNTSGNLLVLAGVLYQRTNAVVTDSQGNTWIVVYNAATGDNTFLVMAYALSCKAGANTVTLNTLGGGDDDLIQFCVAEYTFNGSFTASSRGGPVNPGETVDTGYVAVGTLPSLVISMFTSTALDPEGATSPPLLSQLETLRYQFSDPGFLQETPHTVALADVTPNSIGSYHNVFDSTPITANLEGAILGFTQTPAPPAPTPMRCYNVPLSGTLNTLEVTRDMDANWTDKSTFIITQSAPFPFTLRGIVLRMEYNQD